MEYKKQLQGFPKEVVEKMLEEQERQGNKKDVSVFEDCAFVDREGKGFDWGVDQSCDEYDFWLSVIVYRKFYRFYEKYPKQQQPMEQPNKYPMLMWVGERQDEVDNRMWKRVVLAEKCGAYIAWHSAESIEAAESEILTYAWSFAAPCELDATD